MQYDISKILAREYRAVQYVKYILAYISHIIFFFICIKSIMEFELVLFREENARLMVKITGLEFKKVEFIERVMKLKKKQLENIVIKNLLHMSYISAFGQVSQKIWS